MLIFSAVKTHSFCDDDKEILNIRWTSMKWAEDVNCKTMGSIPNCDMILTADSSIDSDDITVTSKSFR